MTQDAVEFIEHYGKKGMRWGTRSGRKGKAKKTSHDYRETVPLRRRNPKELTNKQLKTATSRINAEQNYRRVNPNRVKQGQMAVKGVLGVVATGMAVHKALNSDQGKAGLKYVTKALKRPIKANKGQLKLFK